MRFSQISLGALALAIATPAMADPLSATTDPVVTAPAVATVTDPAATPADAPAPAVAAVADETAPPPSITINGSATVVTDYRFRGISQTDKNFALQGSLTVSHSSGFYLSVWGSSIDDYVAAGGDQELDLIGGWKKTFGGTTVDVGVLYYFYPNSDQFIPGYNSDFVEPYIALSHTLGPVTGKLTVNYAPSQAALSLGGGNLDNLYGAVDLALAVPKTPISLTAHLGHNFEKSFLSAGRTYTDWGVGASLTWKAITFGINYVDTDLPAGWVVGITGKDEAKGGIFGSIGVAF
jgi:uncharacterized protein (TIGR02001 family)